MLDKFYYINNVGDRIDFGQRGVIANYNDLRDYSWSYEVVNDKISGFSKGVGTKNLPTTFIGGNEEFCRRRRNEAFVIFEKDILAFKKGKLYIGEYYLNCFIFGTENDKYKENGRYLETTFKIATDDLDWHRDVTQQFFATASTSSSSSGFDYPYGYPYDYGANVVREKELFNDSDFESDFTMVIYGPCTDPMVTIGGHRYQVLDTISSDEIITIDSKKKTLIKTTSSREEINIINKRYKKESIFEKIPGKETNINWDGTFGFDITIHYNRSEPVWEYTVAETIDSPNANDLLDDNGDYILDFYGDRIEVSA